MQELTNTVLADRDRKQKQDKIFLPSFVWRPIETLSLQDQTDRQRERETAEKSPFRRVYGNLGLPKDPTFFNFYY